MTSSLPEHYSQSTCTLRRQFLIFHTRGFFPKLVESPSQYTQQQQRFSVTSRLLTPSRVCLWHSVPQTLPWHLQTGASLLPRAACSVRWDRTVRKSLHYWGHFPLLSPLPGHSSFSSGSRVFMALRLTGLRQIGKLLVPSFLWGLGKYLWEALDPPHQMVFFFLTA